MELLYRTQRGEAIINAAGMGRKRPVKAKTDDTKNKKSGVSTRQEDKLRLHRLCTRTAFLGATGYRAVIFF